MITKGVKKRVFAGCVAVVLALSLVIFALFLPQSSHAPVSAFGYSVFKVKTSSMFPAVPAGALVIIKKTDPAVLKEGDIIAFYSAAMGGKAVLHRINSIENGKIFTKGDNNSTRDSQPLTENEILGRCVFASPALGRACSPLGLFLLCPAILAVILLPVGYRLVRKNLGKHQQNPL